MLLSACCGQGPTALDGACNGVAGPWWRGSRDVTRRTHVCVPRPRTQPELNGGGCVETVQKASLVSYVR